MSQTWSEAIDEFIQNVFALDQMLGIVFDFLSECLEKFGLYT